MTILLATNNPGKQREFGELLAPLAITVPAELGLDLDVEETGQTFVENAKLKACAFAARAGRIALADDSGLEVDALDGAPGVSSARYGGPDLTDAERCELLLRELSRRPADHARTARFRCCVVAASPDGRWCTAEGTLEGEIAVSPRGTGGFGYDPIFLLPELGLTAAELPLSRKNEISHRARALAAIRVRLTQTFPELA